MKLIDWRTVDKSTQEIVRKLAVAAVISGEAPSTVVRVFGITKSRLFDWLKRFYSGGEGELNAKPHPGKKRKLTKEQEDWIVEKVIATTPENFGYPTQLWTRKIISEVIKNSSI